MTKALVGKYNEESGEGSILIDESFRKEDPLFRADVLKDWLNEIELEYEMAVKDLHHYLETMRTNSEKHNGNV